MRLKSKDHGLKIVLASKSPRRKELLEELGFKVHVDVSNFDENSVNEKDIRKLVMMISEGKARAVADNHKNSIIVAADTVVYFEGEVIGQQHNDSNAEKTMRKLLGKPHEVYTGITIINTSTRKVLQDTERSVVYLKKVHNEILMAYIKSGQYKGKAGAYNIADPEFESFVEKIEGSHSNIMGLPIEKVKTMIETISKET